MTFLNIMGRKISLNGWTGYKGDMGSWKTGETYYEEFHETEVIYHVAPFLSSTQHRQWIGNDSLIIIFQDEDAGPLKVEHLAALGSVPAAFVIVKPSRGGRYNVAFFSTINVKPTFPASPDTDLDGPTMKEMVLTKLHNNAAMFNYCAPLNRNFFVPRGEFLKTLLRKFPNVKTKSKDAPSTTTKLLQLTHLKKGDTFPPAGDPNASASFQLVTDDETISFYCNAGSTIKWITTMDSVIQGHKLNSMLDGDTPTVSTLSSSGSSRNKGSTPSAVDPTHELIIINATYGVMGPSMSDVTKHLQTMVHQQGGGTLVLNSGSKKLLFPTTKSSGKRHLCVVYKVSENGETKRATYKDDDAVRLPQY